jgi:hypothetical protein
VFKNAGFVTIGYVETPLRMTLKGSLLLPGASKWNKVKHRLFSCISKNVNFGTAELACLELTGQHSKLPNTR